LIRRRQKQVLTPAEGAIVAAQRKTLLPLTMCLASWDAIPNLGRSALGLLHPTPLFISMALDV
jgi:hypothetical protein